MLVLAVLKRYKNMANNITIVPQGEEAKFYVRIDDVEHFNQVRDDFKVTLRYGMQGGSVCFRKKDMGSDDDGFFFTVNTQKMTGRVVAECECFITDHDVPFDQRVEKDVQILMFVAATHCPRLLICPACTEEHKVTYERTFETSIDFDYYYLVDCEMNNLTTTEEDESHLLLIVPKF